MYRGSTKASRVSNREMRRRAEAAVQEGAKATLLLLTVLAQKGGEVTITMGTMEQCARNIQNLDYVMVQNENSHEYTLRLLEGKDADESSTGEHPSDDRLPGDGAGEVEDGSGEDRSEVDTVAEPVVPVAG